MATLSLNYDTNINAIETITQQLRELRVSDEATKLVRTDNDTTLPTTEDSSCTTKEIINTSSDSQIQVNVPSTEIDTQECLFGNHEEGKSFTNVEAQAEANLKNSQIQTCINHEHTIHSSNII